MLPQGTSLLSGSRPARRLWTLPPTTAQARKDEDRKRKQQATERLSMIRLQTLLHQLFPRILLATLCATTYDQPFAHLDMTTAMATDKAHGFAKAAAPTTEHTMIQLDDTQTTWLPQR